MAKPKQKTVKVALSGNFVKGRSKHSDLDIVQELEQTFTQKPYMMYLDNGSYRLHFVPDTGHKIYVELCEVTLKSLNRFLREEPYEKHQVKLESGASAHMLFEATDELGLGLQKGMVNGKP